MIAVKENKVYTVDEMSKKSYLAQGFSICDDDGNVLERLAAASTNMYAQTYVERAVRMGVYFYK